MENCIYPSDVFIVPFESTKAVRSYANFYQLLLRLRPQEQHKVLHVLSNLSRQPGLHRRVVETLASHGIQSAKTEVRTCGWLAQVDENGGSIFHYRPHSKGAEDMAALVEEVLEILGRHELLLRDHRTATSAATIPADSVAAFQSNQQYGQAA